MVIDDSVDDASLTERAIRSSTPGAEILIARDGKEAIDFMTASVEAGRLPDLILLDLKLPGMAGIDLLRELKGSEHSTAIPVVVLSCSVRDPSITDCLAAGADAYLVKPMDYYEYVAGVQRIVGIWLNREGSASRWPHLM
jgi:two-component system response regulator